MYDGIFDISHWQGSRSFAFAKAADFDAVICKATQGIGFVDPMFAQNWQRIADQKMLRGAYHFGVAGDGAGQANYFLGTVNPSNADLIALDFESHVGGDSMSLVEACDFVQWINDRLGRWPVLYGGSYLKETLRGIANPTLSNCPLWLAEYGPHAVLPPGWTDWTLWQFSDDAVNRPEQPVPGVSPCDRDRFAGTREELAAAWPF